MTMLFVRITSNKPDVLGYAKFLGLKEIAQSVGKMRGSVDFEMLEADLLRLVSSETSDFEEKFIVRYNRLGARETLQIITSTEELKEVLLFGKSIQQAPTLFLATAAQLEHVSTPYRISDFLDERKKNKKALEKRAVRCEEDAEMKSMVAFAQRSLFNAAEESVVKTFTMCVV